MTMVPIFGKWVPALRRILFLIAWTSLCSVPSFAQPIPSSSVVIDRTDRQAIKGHTVIAYAWGEMFTPPLNLPRSVINLKEAMNRWTQVTTTLEEHVYLGDPLLLDYSFVFVSTNQSFDLTETEKANLRKFFENGGFMFADNPEPRTITSRGGQAMKRMLEQVLPKAVFAPVPNNDQLYHSFFDFDVPPIGTEQGRILHVTHDIGGQHILDIVHSQIVAPDRYYLEGIWLDGDLVAVYSDKGYVVKWNDSANNEPQLRFGVNLIIYSLTRGNTSAQRIFR